MEEKSKSKFKLSVPLDASGVEDFDPERPVKVVAKGLLGGETYSQTVTLDKKGVGAATFYFTKKPGNMRVMVGPPDASDEEMEGLQTIGFNLKPQTWKKAELTLKPVLISPYYWHWWLIWCRTFTITGHVFCPDGNPVPNATVCAYDVDWWWWWMSKSQVGDCAVTDANGYFEIKFNFCCGWWSWWWWHHRFWYLEPKLADYIVPLLKELPELREIPTPGPKPDYTVFENLLKEDFADLNITRPLARTFKKEAPAAAMDAGFEMSSATLSIQPEMSIEPAALPALRDKLLKLLPKAPELEKLCIWPWYPWYPWRDCTPDIVFKVTQECDGEMKVLLDEGFDKTRPNISTTHHEHLHVGSEACCIDDTPDPEGNCVNITHACNAPISTIGGNFVNPTTTVPLPAGYRYPGSVSASNAGDRPFAGTVNIRGGFGTASGADYYHFEYENPIGSGNWDPLPAGTFSGFTRLYYGEQSPGGPVDLWHVSFPVEHIDGKDVIKTRQYYETQSGLSWETAITDSWWMNNKDMLLRWHTQNNFANGTYKLRVKSYKYQAGQLKNPQTLPFCGPGAPPENYLVLTTDNRVVTSGLTDAHGHNCGPGTVHICTSEPDTVFLDVKIVHQDNTVTDVAACGKYTVNDTDKLRVDFVAHDPAGHLSFYTLNVTYGDSWKRNLLNPIYGAVVTPLSPTPVAWAPPAAQVGPGYSDARTQIIGPAAAPTWKGGAMRLEMDAKNAFPDTCCYQLELRAHKRTIVNCSHSLWGHTNYSEYSFMIEA